LFRGHPDVVDADLADYFGSMSGRIWTPPDCNLFCRHWSKGHNC
jgi:hypothetical protein